MKKSPDYILIGTVSILIILGILILASVSFSISQEEFGSTFYFLKHQIVYGFIPGIILAWIVFKIPINHLKKFVLPFLLINLVFLGLVFLPRIGSEAGGATRWVSFGPISFQPSEFLKVAFILYLASWLKTRTGSSKKSSSFNKKIQNQFPSAYQFNKTFIAFLAILGSISLFLVLQPDVSTLGIISVTALIMYFLAGVPLWHIGSVISIGTASLLVLIKIAPYRMNRFLIFLKPELYPMGIGYHLNQSLIAVGSGGIKGLGLGLSRQRFGFLPSTLSDSAFAIFAEEAGFIGSIVLISLFLIFLIRGFEISRSANDRFLQFAGFGITSWIVIQAFINIGAMIGLLPLTGIPLPFISYGGSAIIAELIGVGILLNISKQ